MSAAVIARAGIFSGTPDDDLRSKKPFATSLLYEETARSRLARSGAAWSLPS